MKLSSKEHGLYTENKPDYDEIIKSLTNSSDIHKQVRTHLIPYIKPGIKLVDIAKIIENKTIELARGYNTINQGIGFPSSLSLNNCAAHFHPKSNDSIAFQQNDVLKIDFGTEVNGWITDSAFTLAFNPRYNALLEATKDCTYTGIKNIGIDVDINEWGSLLQEVMESYEIVENGNSYPIKVIKNLCGHNLKKNIIHGGLMLPPYKNNYNLGRLKEGIYAIETFGVVSFNKNITNYDHVYESGESTLYRLNPIWTPYISSINNPTLDYINKRFFTLPFTNRYVESFDHTFSKKNNISDKIIMSYPPLCVPEKCYTAQYEHTLYVGDNKKIVFSKGDDY